MRERVSARPAIEMRDKSPFKHFGTEAKPGIKVVLCCRVSTDSQKQNLADQEAYLKRIVEDAGGVVVGVVSYAGWGSNPFWLEKAAAIARTFGAILLAETPDRFIRSEDYHPSKRPDAQATDDDFELLRLFVGNVTLMTIVPPNATPGEMRSQQTRRGKQETGSIGGRPKNRLQKRWPREIKSEARLLHANGFSLRDIAAKFDARVSTVQYWVAPRRQSQR